MAFGGGSGPQFGGRVTKYLLARGVVVSANLDPANPVDCPSLSSSFYAATCRPLKGLALADADVYW